MISNDFIRLTMNETDKTIWVRKDAIQYIEPYSQYCRVVMNGSHVYVNQKHDEIMKMINNKGDRNAKV